MSENVPLPKIGQVQKELIEVVPTDYLLRLRALIDSELYLRNQRELQKIKTMRGYHSQRNNPNDRQGD